MIKKNCGYFYAYHIPRSPRSRHNQHHSCGRYRWQLPDKPTERNIFNFNKKEKDLVTLKFYCVCEK